MDGARWRMALPSGGLHGDCERSGVAADEVHVRESCREHLPLMRGLNSSIPATPVRTVFWPLLAQCRLYVELQYTPPR